MDVESGPGVHVLGGAPHVGSGLDDRAELDVVDERVEDGAAPVLVVEGRVRVSATVGFGVVGVGAFDEVVALGDGAALRRLFWSAFLSCDMGLLGSRVAMIRV